MIAAAFGPSPERARLRLQQLSDAAGVGDPRIAVHPFGAVAAWPGCPAGSLATAGVAALEGAPVGPLPEPIADRAAELRGPFAMCGLDKAGALVLARGRFGGRSLFFEDEGDTVVACSRLEPLVRSSAKVRRFDAPGLAGAIGATGAACDRTPFADVLRVRSGEVLHFTRPGTPLLRTPTQHDASTDVPTSEREVFAAIRERLDRAVVRAVGTARSVAVTTSGGLDSSSILALAVALARSRGATLREVQALNVAFDAEGNDRAHFADLIRELRIEPITFAPAEFAAVGLEALTTDARPLSLISSLWQVHMAREARARGAEVILTGSGGDDVFDGDFSLLAPSTDPRLLLEAVARVAQLRGIYFAADEPLRRVGEMILRPLMRSLLPPSVRAWRRRLRPIAPRNDWAGPVLREYLDQPSGREPRRPLSTAERFDDLARDRAYLDYVDARTQVEIASGLPAADPFFDPELVELLSALPADAFFAGGYVRGLLRGALRGAIPESLLRREDKGRYEPAFAAHFRALGGLERIRPLLEMRGLAALGVVDPDRFRARFESFAADLRDPTDWVELWPVLACEAFVEQYRELVA